MTLELVLAMPIGIMTMIRIVLLAFAVICLFAFVLLKKDPEIVVFSIVVGITIMGIICYDILPAVAASAPGNWPAFPPPFLPDMSKLLNITIIWPR